MKKTQRIDLLTTIRGSVVSFFAITMFVALGVGLFLGIHWIAAAMHGTAAGQFDRGNAHDLEITFPYGLTQADVDAIKSLDPEDLEIEASWITFQEVQGDDRPLVFRVGTLPQRIDTFTEVEGTLPQGPDEIALSKITAKRYGYAVGDTISFLPDGKNGEGMRFLTGGTFTVTALVTSPSFLASNAETYGMSTVGSGSIDVLSWTAPSAFKELSYLGSTPYVLIRSKHLSSLDPFGEEYLKGVADLVARVNELGNDLASQRVECLRGLRDVLNSKTVLGVEDVAKKYIDIGKRYHDGMLDQVSYRRELSDLLAQARSLLQAHGVDVSELVDKDEGEALLSLFADPSLSFLTDGTLEMARERLTSIDDYAWIVLSRTYNGAIVLMDGYAGVTANLRWSMASLFLIVGILVCYSAVSRLVHEQASRIGTKKALGFRAKEVNALFLRYAALCVALGMVLGVLIAVFVVEGILLHAMSGQFVVPVGAYASPVDVVLIGALELVLIMGATWLAVAGVLKRQAVELLAGERPPTAKGRFYESWGIWQRMGLLAQTTINNCVNDTRRVVGTLVGVAGCTALIACAVMLNDNVMRSFTRQYSAIAHYDAIANVSAGSLAATDGAKTLEAAGMDAAEVFQRTFTLRQPDGKLSAATVTVPIDLDAYERAMTLNLVGSHKGDRDGVLVSEAYREHLKAEVGDMITLVDATGTKSELPIAGFFEWHMLSHQVIVPQDLYKLSFGADATTNRLLIDTKGKGVTEVANALHGLDGYGSTRDDYAANEHLFVQFSSIARIVVLVYLGLAVVMAACVLLNLDFMFVEEKKRELIVLMINGYSLKDAKGYIWHDSVVLTVLGIICGLLLGSVVGGFTIRSIERANTSFMHGVSWIALGAAVAGTTVLSAAALLVALRRIKRFELTDVNRF